MNSETYQTKERNIMGETEKANRNTLTPQLKNEIILQIYDWAVKLAREINPNEPIHPRPEWIQLANRLRLTHGNLIKVVGPQGAGKTTMAVFLYNFLKTNSETYYRRVVKGLESFGHWRTDRYLEPYVIGGKSGEKKVRYVTKSERDYEYDEKAERAGNIIVDLWDYSKTSSKDIIKALDALQDIWLYRCSDAGRLKRPPPNIVVFLQKEALPLHFFLGKMTLFKLEPWKAEDLVNFYRSQFGSFFPFTEDALAELAHLSGGIMRRFKEYIATCLEARFQSPADIDAGGLITLQDVQRFVTAEKVSADMELTLCELWPRNKENRILAVKVLQTLRKNGPTFQEDITNQFFAGNKMAASRFLNTLALHGFVKFRDVGRKRRWEIA